MLMHLLNEFNLHLGLTLTHNTMDVPILIMVLCYTSLTFASKDYHSHTIPVEGYDTELQNLGQHVEIPETPVKVIKITKTIAVKIPVPYPVKVIEKVPYPVHVNKPYPVPVTHIVKVPQPAAPKGIHGYGQTPLDVHSSHFQNQLNGNSYKVQESPYDTPISDEHYDGSNSQNEGNYGIVYSGQLNKHNSEASPDGYYSGPHDFEGVENNGNYGESGYH